MNFVINHSYLIPLLPLLGAAISGFFGARFLKGQSHWPIWITVGISAILSFTLAFGMIAAVGGADPNLGFGVVKNFFTWIEAGNFKVDAGFFFDPLSAVMMMIVCGVGFLITIFSKGYMAGETGYFRFFAYLGLFIFSMCCVIMGENLIMVYLGWEAVGLSSYLLIGYYYDKPAAREAAKKAFLVNRIGDFGFALGIMLTYYIFGTVSFFGEGVGTTTGIIEMAASAAFLETLDPAKAELIWVIPFLLLTGAIGKSAQFPLYVWLPDAMEGPTPVSALIHAATMVTSGVYMICRCSTLFFPVESVMLTIGIISGFTALFAATIAIRQFDMKKVFAFSTVSQLGYMFVGVATLAPVAGMFHLVTHAFFKALLFLSSGVVMHAMAGQIDIRKISGLKTVLPKTRWLMLIGCCSLGGIIPFAGFWSKDEIIISAYSGGIDRLLLGLVMTATAFLTAYYGFRVYFRVFEGPTVIPEPQPGHGHGHGHDTHAHGHEDTASASAKLAGDVAHSGVDDHVIHNQPAGHDAHGHSAHGHGDHHHNHEPLSMMIPLFVLAIGAALIGFMNTPLAHPFGDFLGHSPSFKLGYQMSAPHYGLSAVDPVMFGQEKTASAALNATGEPVKFKGANKWLIMLVSILIAAAGAATAYLMHLRDRAAAERLATTLKPLAGLLTAKYYVDELYDAIVVKPLRASGKVLFWLDRYVVDGMVWLAGFIPQGSGFFIKLTTQRGFLQGYALTMLVGVAIILMLIFR